MLRHFLGYKETFLSLIAKPALLLSWYVVVWVDVYKKKNYQLSAEQMIQATRGCVEVFFTLCGGVEGRDWPFLCICQWSKVGRGKVSSAI